MTRSEYCLGGEKLAHRCRNQIALSEGDLSQRSCHNISQGQTEREHKQVMKVSVNGRLGNNDRNVIRAEVLHDTVCVLLSDLRDGKSDITDMQV